MKNKLQLKTLFSILLFLVVYPLYSQVDSILNIHSRFMSIKMGYYNFDTITQQQNSLTIDSAGTYTITGDTIKIIRYMVQLLTDRAKRIDELDEIMVASVEATNQVPDYWKVKANNCKWPKYQRLLRKQGYKTVKVKNKKPCQ